MNFSKQQIRIPTFSIKKISHLNFFHLSHDRFRFEASNFKLDQRSRADHWRFETLCLSSGWTFVAKNAKRGIKCTGLSFRPFWNAHYSWRFFRNSVQRLTKKFTRNIMLMWVLNISKNSFMLHTHRTSNVTHSRVFSIKLIDTTVCHIIF